MKRPARILAVAATIALVAGLVPGAAATAAADPDDDPPGECAAFHGLRVVLGCMNASSVVTVLPKT